MAIGYTPGGERTWLQKTYEHLKAAEAASVNAMIHNLDSNAAIFELQDQIAKAIQQTRSICGRKNYQLKEPT